MRVWLSIAVLCFGVFLSSCTKKSSDVAGKKTIWIYTSLYKDVIADMEKKLQARFPQVEFKWYQSGSENVAARIGAELAAGKTLADLVMTSDPFWYLELKKADLLMPHLTTVVNDLPRKFRDPHGTFNIVRIPVLVMAYNKEAVKKSEAPKAWEDLLDPKWKGKVSMGSPLQSGTAFCAVAQLSRSKGWKYFKKLREHNLLSAGGNSAVISRMETKERPVGIVLLENVLDAQRRGSPLEIVYPTDGTMLAPSPIAIMKSTKNPELAKEIYDYFYGEEMQLANIAGRMYSPFSKIPAPTGARDLSLILATSMEWSPKVLAEIQEKRDDIKKRFVEVVLN